MIKFIKIADPNNEFDCTNVVIRVHDGADADELRIAFSRFLLGCGYAPKTVQKLFPDEEDSSNECQD